MSLSKELIEDMRASLQRLSFSKKVSARPALQTMLDLMDPSAMISPRDIFQQYLDRIEAADDLVKVTARDATIYEIVQIFGLHYDKFSIDTLWVLAEESILKEPKILRRNLNDFHDAFYEEDSEATCRIAIDIILIQCRKYLRLKYNPATAGTVSPSTSSAPLKATTKPKKPIKLYPESHISVEIQNQSVTKGKILISGRADWAMGYSSKDEDGALLVAVEAKQQSEFGAGESQLITYLAILRENRRRAGKTNIVTQGFYSDGDNFRFVCIKDDGTIMRSSIWEIRTEEGLSMVFSFIVAMLETALKSTPTASPTKPGILQDKEIHNFDDEVWLKIFKSVGESLAIGDDDGDETM